MSARLPEVVRPPGVARRMLLTIRMAEDPRVHSPVRDDSKTTAHEDLDREPDGVPHGVVGMTAFFAVVFAMLLGAMFLSGGVVGHVSAALLAVVAVPVLARRLGRKADRERDHVHPSR